MCPLPAPFCVVASRWHAHWTCLLLDLSCAACSAQASAAPLKRVASLGGAASGRVRGGFMGGGLRAGLVCACQCLLPCAARCLARRILLPPVLPRCCQAMAPGLARATRAPRTLPPPPVMAAARPTHGAAQPRTHTCGLQRCWLSAGGPGKSHLCSAVAAAGLSHTCHGSGANAPLGSPQHFPALPDPASGACTRQRSKCDAPLGGRRPWHKRVRCCARCMMHGRLHGFRVVVRGGRCLSHAVGWVPGLAGRGRPS